MQTKPKIYFSDFNYSNPPWMGTPQTADKVLLPGGATLNPGAFNGAIVLTVAATPDNSAAVLSVTAPNSRLIAKGTVISFATVDGETTANDVIVTADHTVGPTATNLPVTGIGTSDKPAEDMVATIPAEQRDSIDSGVLIGRTYAERANGLGYRPVTQANLSSLDQIFLLAFPVPNIQESNFAELYMHGNVVYEDKLPGWGELHSTIQAKIRELYSCIIHGGE